MRSPKCHKPALPSMRHSVPPNSLRRNGSRIAYFGQGQGPPPLCLLMQLLLGPFGIIFDQTTLSRHASRPLADTWITWASRWTQEFGARWAELLQAGDDDQVESDATLSDSEPSAGPGSDPLALPEPECRTLDSSSPRTDPLLPSESSQSDQSSEALTAPPRKLPLAVQGLGAAAARGCCER